MYLFGCDGKIYEADLNKRSVRIAVNEGNVRSFTLLDIRSESPANFSWHLAVRTDRDVLVVDKYGNEQQRHPIPQELRELPIIFGETTAGEAVMYWNKDQTLIDTEDQYSLFWVRPDGSSRTAALTLSGRPIPALRYIIAAVLPSPIPLAISGILRARELQESIEPSFSSGLLRTIREFWQTWLLVQSLAVCLAVLCYRRRLRYGTRRAERIAWPLFVLLLGLPGWIGYRFGRSWPSVGIVSRVRRRRAARSA